MAIPVQLNFFTFGTARHIKGEYSMLIHTPEKNIAIAEVFRNEAGEIFLRWKKPSSKVYEEIPLSRFLDLVYKAAGEPA